MTERLIADAPAPAIAAHDCGEQFVQLNSEGFLLAGEAILGVVYRNTQGWFVSNHEYGTYVRFCPFCGLHLPE